MQKSTYARFKGSDWTYCSKINLRVMLSCSHWPTDPTHVALAEVHRHLALVPELAVHGCPHQQVRQAVLVQINCTQWGAKVRAHLEPSRATEQWVRSQTLFSSSVHTIDMWFTLRLDLLPPFISIALIKEYLHNLCLKATLTSFYLFWMESISYLPGFGFWRVCSSFESLSKHLRQT